MWNFLLAALLVIPFGAQSQIVQCSDHLISASCSAEQGSKTLSVAAANTPETTMPIYLCKAYVGDTSFWTTQLCSKQQATIERIVRVPRDLPWEVQVEIARGAHRQGQALAKPPRVTQNSPQTTDNTSCLLLEQRIEALDSAARMGGSASYMEHLAEQRRQALKQRSKLRCR